MDSLSGMSTYHVLLIGIDAYPPGASTLTGCVNDIDAIEHLLLDAPGVGISADQIRIKRLAASYRNRPSTSRFQDQTQPPTRDNVIQALRTLASSETKSSDRVLIYYSGHGDQRLWRGSPIWHEALVPTDGQQIQYLYDIQVNSLIKAIAARTQDLTIVLDCCHSAGAFRDLADINAQGADRFLGGDDTPDDPPDLRALGLDESTGATGQHGRLLQLLDPPYLVIVACQPDEKAGEGGWVGEPATGVFTHSLLRTLQDRDATQRAAVRWGDVWPELLTHVVERAEQLQRRPQHPWLIGRSERRIFGGPWEEQDIGYPVTRTAEGVYRLQAGTLVGVTKDARIAVYGPTPARFPPLGSPMDKPIGHLIVTEATRSQATARYLDGPLDSLEGARGRLVEPGQGGRLQVRLQPEEASLAEALEQSPLLEVVPTGAANANVEVRAQPGGGWAIGSDVEPVIALVPANETLALRAGLESYYQYHNVLRLARNCHDPQLDNTLLVSLLDCRNKAAVESIVQSEQANPELAEVPRDGHRVYNISKGFPFCIKVTNTFTRPSPQQPDTLNVTLLNCTAGGAVEYIGDITLRSGDTQLVWRRSIVGNSFKASPDELPAPTDGKAPLPFVTDRLVAIGTTRREADLRPLRVEKAVQTVVNENLGQRGLLGEAEPAPEAPVELWTATVTPVRIARQ